MNYQETLEWLFTRLPMYQRIGQAAYKADLKATRDLVAYLHHPEKEFKSIHIAGTNGKGSTSHMLASVFQVAGYKTGLYTSPHLKDFRERIKIDGKMISEEEVVSFIAEHKQYFLSNQLSFFEMTVGMAFDYFRKEQVDIAIIETGMGGRLDSTNVIHPEASVITNIGLDHTQFLGNTLAAIATEKAGIIKEKVPVIIGETTPETKSVFINKAIEKNAPISFAETMDNDFSSSFVLDLKGNYQEKNVKTVLTTLEVLREMGWEIPDSAIKEGLASVVTNTGLMGRWHILKENPKVICDTGHNKEGLSWVMKQIKETPHKNLHIVVGMVSDKDINSVLPLFPKKATYYFCKPDIPRGMEAGHLAAEAERHQLLGGVFSSVTKAYQTALQKAESEDLIFIGGSTFVVAEVME
ncbi:MAG TPA: folylpolyglutamate synthase/dihydrofolate synthase family protein [Flavobacteriaceae bacterium]|nr:folylpolyglutamate synthase/dihydrofolate synthase family protein [Flavobacteriaceae bacterium]